MENLRVGIVYLDGANLFLVLLIILLVFLSLIVLGCRYIGRLNQIDRLELANRRLRRINEQLTNEKEDYKKRLYETDFHLMMKSEELDNLKKLHKSVDDTSSGSDTEEVTGDNV